jgi:choline dehydrogenase
MAALTYDYVIIGAGAAGSVVANRLSADSAKNVLLLESGGPGRSPLLIIPAGFAKLIGTKVNWIFDTVPQKHMANRTMFLPQGKVLGGSTAINAMLYVRGHRLDFDEWEALGNKGWGYRDVLPYFKRSENNERLVDEFHASGGPLNVADQVQHNPLSAAFVRAAQQVGLPYNADPNGADQSGVFYNQLTQRNARRESAATAFLHPIRHRENLTIVTGATVTRLNTVNGTATGVSYTHNGQHRQVNANAEVILSAGAINSPRLLLLSGIGPADELTAVGIRPVHDLPGVGKNLHDQLEVSVTARCRQPISYTGEDRWHKAVFHGLQYLLYRTGPATATVSESGAFIKSSDDVRSPDIQLHMQPAYVQWDEARHKIRRIPGHGITLLACNVRPKSRGSVTLVSADPGTNPAIDPNYLDHPDDIKTSLEGFRWIRKILAAPAFEEYIDTELSPGPGVNDDDEVIDFIRTTGGTDYHPVGTCKMGSDGLAVVDDQLRVHGIDRLRVIDASIMPTITSGNTQAPSFMIGEKGADLVVGHDQP